MKRYLFLLILFINLLPRAFNEEWSWQCSSMYAMYGEIPEVTIIPDPKPKPDPPQPTPIPLPLPEPDYPTPPDPGIPSWWEHLQNGNSGGGSSGLPADLPTTDAQKQEFVRKIIAAFKKFGVDASKIKIIFFDDGQICMARAQLLPTGEIKVCLRFFYLSEADQISCFNHELYHKNHDKETTESRTGKFAINIPEEYYPVLKILDEEEFGGSIPPYLATEEFKNYLDIQESIDILMHPDYYQNEINAYEDQLNNNDLPISDTYRKECEYMLWRSKELFKLATKEFKK